MTKYFNGELPEGEDFEFLKFLFKDCEGYMEFRAIKHNNSNSVRQIFNSTLKPLSLEEIRQLNSEGFNIYFGVGTRLSERGTKDSVYHVPALWVDIDSKQGEDIEIIFERINAIGLQTNLVPSGIVNSGNGVHLYFKLRRVFRVKCQDDVRELEGRVRWLAHIFGGDYVSDISRVMRLPGLLNWKDSTNPKKCTVIEINPKALYELSNFKSYTNMEDNMKKIILGDIPTEIPGRFYDLLTCNAKLNETWQGNRSDLGDATGSGYDLALASLSVREGFSNEEIAKIITETPYEKRTPRNKAYLEHTIGKARSSYDFSKQILSTQKLDNNILADLSLKTNDFDQSGVEYLIDNFLPDKSLILLTSKYGEGKSILALAIAKRLILEGKKVIIIDADMSVPVIGDRLEAAGLKSVLSRDLFYLHSTKIPMKIKSGDGNWDNFKNQVAAGGYIIIFDNFKDLSPFGADLDRDGDVIPIMNELKKVRDMGNTVILLHHVSKEGSQKHPFKNSGSIADAVDVAYLLVRQDKRFMLSCYKERIPVKKNMEFLLESDFTLHTKETEKEIIDFDNMINIYQYLIANPEGMLQRNIIETMNEDHGVSKAKVARALEKGEDKLWSITRGEKKALVYCPIEQDMQKSKNLPPYILKNLGFLDNTEKSPGELIASVDSMMLEDSHRVGTVENELMH